MSNKSFAEILNEFSQNKKNHASSRGTKDFPQQTFADFSKEQTSYEISQMELLKSEHSKYTYERSFQFKNQKAYAEFATKKKSNEQPNPLFKSYKSKPQEQIPTTEPKKRVTGKPHQLNETQKQAFTYFIKNLEFLHEDFTKEELKKSFKKLCFKNHPDSPGGSHQNFLELKKNYDQLLLVFKKAS